MSILTRDPIDEAADLAEDVEDFILRGLKPLGIRLVVTSRPEGIRAARFASKAFVMLNLKELSPEQQLKAVEAQLGGNEFFDNLMNVGRIRTAQDNL